MLGRLSHTNLLRYAGIYTWALVGLPIILNIWFLPPSRGLDGNGISVPMTALAYFSFGACYWLATGSLGRGGRRAAAWNVLLLLAMNAAAIGVGFYTQTGLGAVLLMIMAGVLPWLAGIRIAVLWLVVAHIALVPSFMARDDFNFWESLLQSLFYVGFSAFVLTTAYVARQQAQARDEQRRLNAELRATRALLAESARVNERTRISRELHDLLGHHLTALSLNLEVASHMTEGRPQEHVRQAHTLAKLLLTDVREAVSQLRDASGGIDLATALREARGRMPHTAHLEVEVDRLDQVEPVLAGGADTIMLDNFTLDDLRTGVELIAGRAIVEASGGVDLDTVGAIAATGVDVISVGALTHSARALDLGLDVVIERADGTPRESP